MSKELGPPIAAQSLSTVPSELAKENQKKFFVYIIESPSAPDIYHGRSEKGLIENVLKLNGIPCTARTAINTVAFEAAFTITIKEVMDEFPGMIPIIHLSAHGDVNGIQLSTGDIINWRTLRKLLVPINAALNGGLLLCISACKGFNGCKMAMETEDVPLPYRTLVGNWDSPTWAEAAVAYSAFYHLLARGSTMDACVNAMRIASCLVGWYHETADASKQSYIDYIKNETNAALALENVENQMQAAPPSSEAKALEMP